jgi:hypothetical protein
VPSLKSGYPENKDQLHRPAAEGIEAELAAEKAARIKDARGKPVAQLTVTPVGRKGHTSEHPG